jgi:uncharacterized protein YbjQ (UPF0145 family)
MLMTTTDTLPQSFTPLGLVSAEIGGSLLMTSERGARKWLGKAEDQLVEQTRELGGDAIIGVHVSALVGVLMVTGTAVKLG